MNPCKPNPAHFFASLLGAVLFVFAAHATAQDAAEDNPDEGTKRLVAADGSYATVPLEKDKVVVKVVQNGVRNLQDFPTIEEGLAHNLAQMSGWARKACSEGRQPDFILFNEFPLTGYSSGSREEKLKFTIEIPGPETAALGKIASECDCYIIFGSYARDAEWPGHILSLNAVIGRNGEVVEKFWKTRSVKRLYANSEISTTTIENVYDRYHERYGEEALFPVLRTEYGNIAVSTVQLDPLVFMAFAMRGVEIMFRTSTLFSRVDVQATALHNRFYTAMSNITFPPGSDWANMGGQSIIAGPDGKLLADDPTNNESIIEAELDIAKLREGRTIPHYPVEVTRAVLEQYQQEIPLNHLDVPENELPQTGEDMKALMDRQSRWLHPQANPD